MNDSERVNLDHAIGSVFTPAAPIDERALFAGRNAEVRQVIDAINQRGQHVIIFGERGVGKTSLANVLTAFLRSANIPEEISIIAPRANCETGDDYSRLWKKIFSEITLSRDTRRVSLIGGLQTEYITVADELPGTIEPEDVRRTLRWIGAESVLIVVIDEFDRLTNVSVHRQVADTIKTLSDQAVDATLVIVGVADTVNGLLGEHESIERALVQVRMPRMSPSELKQIVDNGLTKLRMTIEEPARDRIALLSQGLPHYTHLLSLHAARLAVADGRRRIRLADVEEAIRRAIHQGQHSILTAYSKAISSPQKGHLYAQVLLACALAPGDKLGYFAAADVRSPMGMIMGRPYDIPWFSRHLKDFCEEARGPILERIGKTRRFRFRFINPIMQPYVILLGVASGLVTQEHLQRIAQTGSPSSIQVAASS